MDGFRHDYAALLYESGDHVAAARLIRQIVYPSLLADISLDKRFRDFLPAEGRDRSGGWNSTLPYPEGVVLAPL